MKIIGVYQIRNLVNGKIYIGSSNNIIKRWYGHKCDLRAGKHHSQYLQRSWDKYGKDNLILEIIEQCSSQDLFNREQYWLNLKLWADYNDNRFNKLGYNINRIAAHPPSLIGPINHRYGKKHTEETRAKMSKAQLGNQNGVGRIVSQATRDRLSQIHKGKSYLTKEAREKIGQSLRGRRHSQLTKDKIGLAHKNKIISETTKHKMSMIMRGRKLSAEHKEALSKNHADMSGHKNPMWNKKHTEEVIKKISGANNHRAKLSEEDVIKIRQLCSQRLSDTLIAKQFNTSRENIRNIRTYKTWKFI